MIVPLNGTLAGPFLSREGPDLHSKRGRDSPQLDRFCLLELDAPSVPIINILISLIQTRQLHWVYTWKDLADEGCDEAD